MGEPLHYRSLFRWADTVRHRWLRGHPSIRAAGRPAWNALTYVLTAGRGFRHVINNIDCYRLALECNRSAAPINWEPAEYANFMAHVGPGAQVIDLGASIGLFAIGAALRAGPAGRVVAVEPSPQTHRLLCCNIRCNRLEHVIQTVPAVCCDRDADTVDFFVAAAGSMVDSAVPRRHPGAQRLRRPTTTVDALVHRFALEPNLIKIDVEGFEDLVLRGACDTLARHRPVLFLEFHVEALRARSVAPSAVFALLSEQGYRSPDWERLKGGELASGVLCKFAPGAA